MADAQKKPFMWPGRGSLFGRLIKMCLVASVGSVAGATAGGIAKGTVGAIAGGSLGASAGILGFGVVKAVKDKRKWRDAQFERAHEYSNRLTQWWSENKDKAPEDRSPEPEPLENEQRTKRFKRAALNTLATAAGGVTLGAMGLLPAITALPAFGVWAAAMGASYVLTRLVYRPKTPDFEAIRTSIVGVEPEQHSAPEQQQQPQAPPRNQPYAHTTAAAAQVPGQVVNQNFPNSGVTPGR